VLEVNEGNNAIGTSIALRGDRQVRSRNRPC
jgi:hypothetical protein